MMIHEGVLQGCSTNYKQGNILFILIYPVTVFRNTSRNLVKLRSFSKPNNWLQPVKNKCFLAYGKPCSVLVSSLGFLCFSPPCSVVRHPMSCVKRNCTILQKEKPLVL